MSAHRYRSTFRDVIFNRRYPASPTAAWNPEDKHSTGWDETYLNSDFRLDSLEDFEVQTADYREMRQLLEGSTPNQVFETLRVLNLRGAILALNSRDLEDKTWLLREQFSPMACRVASASLTPPDVLPYSFRRDSGASPADSVPLRYFVRPLGGRPVIVGRRGEGYSRPTLIRLVAFDPRAYGESEVATALGNLAGGNNTVSNAGNLPTDPLIDIVLSGAGHASFTLTNAATGYVLVLNLSGLTAGTYRVNVQRATITKTSDGSNALSSRSSGFLVNMFLVPGTNTVTVTGNTNLTSVTFRFRPAYA